MLLSEYFLDMCTDYKQDLLADAFYMILGHIVQKSSSSIRSSNGILSLDKSPHFCRMANCYVKMIKRMNVRDLPSFMGYFELVLACAVVLCFKVKIIMHGVRLCIYEGEFSLTPDVVLHLSIYLPTHTDIIPFASRHVLLCFIRSSSLGSMYGMG